MVYLEVLIVAASASAAFAWFLSLERRGKAVTVVMFVVWTLIAESAIYQSQNEVPAGLFHPTIAGVSFRAVDALIPLAILARLVSKREPLRLDAQSALWAALLIWLAVSMGVGAYIGNDPGQVTFQGKLILFLALVPLAAGVGAREYLERRRLIGLIWGCAAIAAVLIVMDSLGLELTASIPLLPLDRFGLLGTDAATVFVTVGLVGLSVGMVSTGDRHLLLLPAAVLLATPLISNQRAALLGVAVSLLVLALCVLLARRRLRVTPTEGVLTVLVVGALVLAPLVIQAAVGDRSATLPLQAELTEEFGGRETVLTNQDRLNQWHTARELIAERPLFGWGLGKTFTYYEPGFREFQEFNSMHNVVGDLLLRTGIVGAGLFLAAVGGSLLGAVRVWRESADNVVAAVGLALAAALAGLLAKGMVEDLFEKYRLAALLGIIVGMTISLAAARRAEPLLQRTSRLKRIPAHRPTIS